jgi:peptidoglycan hydrolase-like protein with peptidoglycan-binding domain
VRTDLSTTAQVAGTLGFAGSYQLVNQRPGRALTALPALGDRIQRGAAAYEVDGVGIPLFYGTRPLWRDLQPGVAQGPDVQELNANLVALGFTDSGRLVADDHDSSHTIAAVDAWQRARGVPATGIVHLGDVVTAPGPVRIAAVAAALGAPPQPGAVIAQATSLLQVVNVDVPVTQEYLVHVGNAVTVTLPDGYTTTAGTVFAIGTDATTPANQSNQPGPVNQGNGTTSDQSDTVVATIVLRDAASVEGYTNAAVTVTITSAQVRGVLAVPINALVALAEGGYAVEVIDGTQRRLVAVQAGLFANSLVEINGPGITTGVRVEVPTS